MARGDCSGGFLARLLRQPEQRLAPDMGAAVVFRDLNHGRHRFRLFADAQPKYGFLAYAVARVLRDQPPQNLIAVAATGATQPESGLFP